MRPALSRLKHLPLPAKALTAVIAFAALLSLALPAPGRGPRARSPMPRSRASTPVQAAPRSQAGSPELTSLRIGPGPVDLASGRRVVATFITNDEAACHVMATARLAAASGPAVIRWTVEAPAGFQAPPDAEWTGPRLDVTLRRPGGNPGGRGGPLSITVEARAPVNGQERAARQTVVQDELDQLRQEYVDLRRRRAPDRSEFIDAATFAARYSRPYPWLRFEDLNWSVNPNTGHRYSWAILRPELLEGLDQVRRAYGSVVINSGYRNPVHQVEVHASIRESLHQYGYAADLAVIPGEGRALPDEADWRRLAEAACSARAKWVEPLESSAPNSPGCHVHLDYRPGPASSAPVHLRGQVVEAQTGRPLAGALVLLGAMPARTDRHGVFGVRTVLSGGVHPIEVHADGFSVLHQPVRLAAWGSACTRLALLPAPPRSFAVAVARVHWVDWRSRLLVATLRVANTGAAAAGDVRLTVMPAPAALISEEPADLGALPAAAVRGVRVVLRLPRVPAPEPLAVSLAYLDASGAVQKMHRELTIVPPVVAGPAAAIRAAKKPPARALPQLRTTGSGQVAGAPSSPAPARPAAPEVSAPGGHGAEPSRLPAPLGSAPDPAKGRGPAGKPPEPGGDATKRAQKPATPSSSPAAPTAAGTHPSAAPAADPTRPGIKPLAGASQSPVSVPKP